MQSVRALSLRSALRQHFPYLRKSETTTPATSAIRSGIRADIDDDEQGAGLLVQWQSREALHCPRDTSGLLGPPRRHLLSLAVPVRTRISISTIVMP